MPLYWTDPTDSTAFDSYTEWSQMIRTRRAALAPVDPHPRNWFEPVFIRLKPDAATPRDSLAALVDDPAQPFVMDPHEYARLALRRQDPDPLAGLPDEYALYRRLDASSPEADALFDVLDLGSAIDLDTDTTPAPAPVPPRPPLSGKPIVAAIDDGIGFLNRRFRRCDGAAETSRFHAIWLQSDESMRHTPAGTRRAWAGQVLTGAEIDGWLAAGGRLDETSVYRALNALLHPGDVHCATDRPQRHGTAVLDLAAGADPLDTEDPARDWPLLAVQLPPEAIEDTSGTRFASYLVQGLRWILMQAAEIDPSQPVIVNVSLGMLAGPKDGTRFAEYQIAREAEAWERVTGQPVRVVLSFGNSRRSRQVARLGFRASRKATARSIEWRTQPADRTASYCEIHAHEAAADRFTIGLTAPDGTRSDLVPLAPGQCRTLMAGEAPVARIYRTADAPLDSTAHRRPHYVLALAPTEGLKAGEPAAPAGAWRIEVSCAAGDAAEARLEIQRDDTLPGYRPRGRQSYFDDARAYEWDRETGDWHRPHPKGPIRRGGCHSALATAPARQVFCVGAARHSPYLARPRPARYSGEGVKDTIAGPSVAGIAEDGIFLSGVIASGTTSESAFALNGTSAAAARITRALALSPAEIAHCAATGDPDRLNDFAPAIVSLPAGKAPERLGQAVIDPGCGARPRR